MLGPPVIFSWTLLEPSFLVKVSHPFDDSGLPVPKRECCDTTRHFSPVFSL